MLMAVVLSYLEEVEVAVAVDAGDLQVAHHHLTVLVALLQRAVLLVQVRQRAQLVLCAGTHCAGRQRQTHHFNNTNLIRGSL